MITATANSTAGAPRPSGLTDYISPSRLNLWLRCPLAFKLRYVDGVVTPPTPATFVGKVVHSVLEAHYRHRQLGLTLPLEALLVRLQDYWRQAAADDAMQFESVAEEANCQRQAAELVTEYLAQLPADEPKPLAVEATVEAPLIDPITDEDLGLPLLGIMDLVRSAEPRPLSRPRPRGTKEQHMASVPCDSGSLLGLNDWTAEARPPRLS